MKRILLLGGTGALGVYLVPELLDNGYEVIVTSRKERKTNIKNLKYIKGDAKDKNFIVNLFKQYKFNAVVDFMIYSLDEFKERYNLFLNKTEHYVFLSSYRVYSDNGLTPITENTPRLLDVTKDEEYLETKEYGIEKARQENVLFSSKLKNWTILRPAITYSKERFQLGTMEAHEFLIRALNGEKVIFPREMLPMRTTMSWARDIAKMMSKVILNEETYGEIYTVSTSESRTWKEVLKYYKEFLNLKVKYISLKEYEEVIGRKYQIKYDRMFHRVVDNSKILKTTKINQKDLMPLKDGLRIELTNYSKNQEKKRRKTKLDKDMDKITENKVFSFLKKMKPRTRLRQIKMYMKSKFIYDGAIVTLTVYNNYGNIIQRYALQKFLEENNYKFPILDFHKNKTNKNHYNLKQFVQEKLLQVKFNARTSKYFKVYIVGSDQVWRNFSVNKGWKNFGRQFLNFVKNDKVKRISYAASFGVGTLEEADINENIKNKTYNYINKFDNISVREESGLKLVEELGYDKNTPVRTLDPTLLLDVEKYNSLIENSKYFKENKSEIFYYLIDKTPIIDKTIRHYETHKNTKAEGILPYQDPKNNIPLPSMEQWLKSIKDAEIVITDSYHAVLFSVIFNTDFIVYEKESGGIERIEEFMEMVGIKDRVIYLNEQNDNSIENKLKPIIWDDVEDKLGKLKETSRNWLLDNIDSKGKK